MVKQRIELADFLLIAERILEIRAEDLVNLTRIPEAESALAAPFASFGGLDFYPDPITQAAVLCSRIIRNHPLPDGNKRVAYLCMLETLDRAGLTWTHPPGGQDETADVIEAVADRSMPERDFIGWVSDRVSP